MDRETMKAVEKIASGDLTKALEPRNWPPPWDSSESGRSEG